MQIILASKSPRRKEILSMLGADFKIITEETDESSDITDAHALVRDLSLRKGRAVYQKLLRQGDDMNNCMVIAADTVVLSTDGRHIYGKPHSVADAAAMLEDISGKTHSVISGVAVLCGGIECCGAETSYVTFSKMSKEDIDFYISSGEPFDKAGGYAVQGLASLYIERIEGDYFNIVGLPVYLLKNIIADKFHMDIKKIFNIKEQP